MAKEFFTEPITVDSSELSRADVRASNHEAVSTEQDAAETTETQEPDAFERSGKSYADYLREGGEYGQQRRERFGETATEVPATETTEPATKVKSAAELAMERAERGDLSMAMDHRQGQQQAQESEAETSAPETDADGWLPTMRGSTLMPESSHSGDLGEMSAVFRQAAEAARANQPEDEEATTADQGEADADAQATAESTQNNSETQSNPEAQAPRQTWVQRRWEQLKQLSERHSKKLLAGTLGAVALTTSLTIDQERLFPEPVPEVVAAPDNGAAQAPEITGPAAFGGETEREAVTMAVQPGEGVSYALEDWLESQGYDPNPEQMRDITFDTGVLEQFRTQGVDYLNGQYHVAAGEELEITPQIQQTLLDKAAELGISRN